MELSYSNVDDIPVIPGRYQFIYQSKDKASVLFDGPQWFWPFDADDVFSYSVKDKFDSAIKRKLIDDVLNADGKIVAISPQGETLVLGETRPAHPGMIFGRRFTAEFLGVERFAYAGNWAMKAWWTLIDFIKVRVIRVFW